MSITWAITKRMLFPVIRFHARALKDRPADAAMRFLSALVFWVVHRYWPRLKSPRSFSEKILSRMLFDRDPKWTALSDKLRVRDYVERKVGMRYLIPLLWTGYDPEEIPFDQLPMKFVIKTNHGCGYNVIVHDKTKLDLLLTKAHLKDWLSENFCQDKYFGAEWAYKNIRPTIMVESFLDDDGRVPLDYKFFCYQGKAKFLQMNFDRFGDPYEKFFDRDFNPLDFWNGTKQYPKRVPRPDNYEELIHLAEAVSEGIDFIRVDLYDLSNRIYVGELTCYPAGATVPFVPRSYDFLFGENWNKT